MDIPADVDNGPGMSFGNPKYMDSVDIKKAFDRQTYVPKITIEYVIVEET